MNIKLATLNRRIIFQDYEELFDDLGSIIKHWHNVIEMWAKVEPKQFLRTKVENKYFQENRYKIFTRFHREISPRMRIKYQGHSMQIESIENLNCDNSDLIIHALEKIKI